MGYLVKTHRKKLRGIYIYIYIYIYTYIYICLVVSLGRFWVAFMIQKTVLNHKVNTYLVALMNGFLPRIPLV